MLICHLTLSIFRDDMKYLCAADHTAKWSIIIAHLHIVNTVGRTIYIGLCHICCVCSIRCINREHKSEEQDKVRCFHQRYMIINRQIITVEETYSDKSKYKHTYYIQMSESSFLSPSSFGTLDESQLKFITVPEFLLNCGFVIGGILVSFVVWKYLWLSTNKLRIPVLKDHTEHTISNQSNIFVLVGYVRAILRQMVGVGDNCLITKCGFEYYTYIFFLRRLCLIMAVLMVTDLCVWIPYQLFFQPLANFSLITMPNTNNNDFQAFYTIWVAFIILYSINDMKKYLASQLKYRYYRSSHSALLNNLKAKTLHMEFIDGHFIDQASIKAQMQQYLVEDMKQEDRILAVLAIPTYSDLLQIESKIKITDIITEYGVNNLSWIWKFFKEETEESLLEKRKELMKTIRERIDESYKQRNIQSCMIIVSHIETAERLCQEFQIGKALCNICPEIGYASEEATWKVADSKMIVRWAQEPKDIVWTNMSSHRLQIFKFILFNFLCVISLIASFVIIVLSTTSTFISMPSLIGPLLILIVNVLLRFLISKMVEWENKILKSEWQIKEYKMTIIYFIINVILGSMVRDTLNLVSILSTGWGWIELFTLIFKQADGLFYYVFILNQTAVSFFSSLVKPGELFLDCYQAGLWYQKNKVKRKALYGRNQSFRLGYMYSLTYMVLTVVVIYSVSCPLIHLFGLLFFLTKMYLDTYTVVVFHEEEVCSNMRMIEKVVQTIFIMVGFWIFLIATTLVFGKNYSNAIVLYAFCGIIIYFAAGASAASSLKDAKTDEHIYEKDIRSVIEEWKRQYTHPFNATQYQIFLDAFTARKNRVYSPMKRQ